jgi:hypothetical protein
VALPTKIFQRRSRNWDGDASLCLVFSVTLTGLLQNPSEAIKYNISKYLEAQKIATQGQPGS